MDLRHNSKIRVDNNGFRDDTGADTAETVDLLTDLAAGGSVLELAIGFGQVAFPLAERELSVHGIDAGKEMVVRFQKKPGGNAAIPVTIGDFAEVAVDGEYDLIYLVANTIYNLTTQDEQVRCFRNMAQHLTNKGLFLVKAFIPDLAAFSNSNVRTTRVTIDSKTLETLVHNH